ncbi:MAG: DUF952 domain-containing protein [Candidatus Eremiobacterota bacterium]
MIYHLTPRSWWEAHAHAVYRHPSLDEEGFIHCSTREQLVGTANRYFRGVSGLVALVVDPTRLRAEVRWEGGFPHVYGPLEREAVLGVVAFPPGRDGTFTLPEGLVAGGKFTSTS